jgi:hypothetical protein
MIEEGVKQTRCTTCEAEHEYKQGKAPVLRRAKVALAPPSASPLSAAPLTATPLSAMPPSTPGEHALPDNPDAPAFQASAEATVASAPDPHEADAQNVAPNDDGSVHRRLIRATLPRPEGHLPERRAMEFTVRQPGSRGRENDENRGGRFRGSRSQGQGHANDFGSSFGGSRHGSGGAHGGFGGRNGHADGQRGGPSGRGPRPMDGSGSGRKRGR